MGKGHQNRPFSTPQGARTCLVSFNHIHRKLQFSCFRRQIGLIFLFLHFVYVLCVIWARETFVTQATVTVSMKTPLRHAVLAEVYIITIVSGIWYAPRIFDIPDQDTIMAPIGMLSLFVLSAAIMGYLFCFVPFQQYLDGNKEQAVRTFLATVGYFAICTLLVFGIALIV